MSTDQWLLIAIILGTIGLFVWGRLRHDMVALASLLACVLAGLVPANAAFAGFGHPAVITVACVLVLSYGLQLTGAIDGLMRMLIPQSAGPITAIAVLAGTAAVLSAFMNNVGALALLMPLALQLARKTDLPPGKLLMPLAFGSILGGMITLIGTPPNLIVSGFRAEEKGQGFAMFDFAPVGLAVALAGLAFLVLIGWRLVPDRGRSSTKSFANGRYLSELTVEAQSPLVGKLLHEVEAELGADETQIVALVQDDHRIAAPSPFRAVRAGDVLVVEAETQALLGELLERLALSLADAKAPRDDSGEKAKPTESDATTLESGDVELMEFAVGASAALVGYSARGMRLRQRFGINLLAISRKGEQSIHRIKTAIIMAGDLLLMQGTRAQMEDFASAYGCVPLAPRELRIADRSKAFLSIGIMVTAIAAAALGFVPAAVAFAAGLLAVAVFGIVPMRKLYDAIDWPVIVLLAALMPVAGAMASTGTADVIARELMRLAPEGSPLMAIAIILIVTMTLSDVMNNAATAAVMCPIALGAAAQMQANPDGFLMAVAIGASCAFLTPIGHQNNTLILGPGGFRFGDYWKLGLPLEIIVIVVAVPTIGYFWG